MLVAQRQNKPALILSLQMILLCLMTNVEATSCPVLDVSRAGVHLAEQREEGSDTILSPKLQNPGTISMEIATKPKKEKENLPD